ncbi:MAG: hypothetical protein PHO27_01740 [Sulfuricurvum sp.]|nr:hypothetical protein [Sulfuricurvum sp.]
MSTIEWFNYLERLNGKREVARMFANGEWKIDFSENSPTFICYSERECGFCPNCTREFCLCSIESTATLNHIHYHEQLSNYCTEFTEHC